MTVFCIKETGNKQVQSSSDTVDVHTKETASERNTDAPELYGRRNLSHFTCFKFALLSFYTHTKNSSEFNGISDNRISFGRNEGFQINLFHV